LTGLNPRLSAADAAMPERPRAPAFFMRGKYRFPPHAAIPVPLPSSLRCTQPYPYRRHHHPAAHSTALVASIASGAAITLAARRHTRAAGTAHNFSATKKTKRTKKACI